MTESLWNQYDISRKSSEVPVKRRGEEGLGTWTEIIIIIIIIITIFK